MIALRRATSDFDWHDSVQSKLFEVIALSQYVSYKSLNFHKNFASCINL